MATWLRKGSRVEVMQQNADERWMPPYSWHYAELLSFNSRQFIVRFEDSKAALQLVPKDWIRPRPPPFVGRFPWRVGDMVEVFENYAWWPANVVDVNAQSQIISVWPLNSIRDLEIRVRPSKLRLRKQWIHEQWSIIDKFTNYEYRLETEEDFPFGGGGGKAPACDDRESYNTIGLKWKRSTEEEEELRQRLRRVTFSPSSPASPTSSMDYSSHSSSSSMDDSADSSSSSVDSSDSSLFSVI